MSKNSSVVTIWIKDTTVNVVFSDNRNLVQKICNSKEEAEQEYDTIHKMLSERGHVIKIKGDED